MASRLLNPANNNFEDIKDKKSTQPSQSVYDQNLFRGIIDSLGFGSFGSALLYERLLFFFVAVVAAARRALFSVATEESEAVSLRS